MGFRNHALVIAICASVILAACAARPRQRPLNTTRIEPGENSMEAVRTRLQGRWTLVSLSLTAADGRQSAVDATGALTFDTFGNLAVEYRLSENGLQTLEKLGFKTPTAVISTTGNVAIDPVKQEITYVGKDGMTRALAFDPELAANRANPFALERVRHYSFAADDELVLSTRHDNGKDAAVARWKRGA